MSSNYKHPIDNFLVDIADTISPFFKQMNFTPNGLTTISLIFSIGSLYHMARYEITMFAIFLVLAYFFDVFDGHYARKYDMVTANGDKYDHLTDLVLIIGIVYILIDNYKIQNYPAFVLILITLGVLTLLYTGCYNKLTDNDSDTLKVLDVLTPSTESCNKHIDVLKYTGSVTWIIALIGIVWYIYNTPCVLDITQIR